MNTIVVGYDDSEPATRALNRAAELATAFEAKIVVLSVAPSLVGASHGIGPIDPVDTPELRREELGHAATVLEEHGIEADYQVATGQPADAILRLADEAGADLIVVGTREPSLITRLLGLSVSEAVQRRAHADVLIVH